MIAVLLEEKLVGHAGDVIADDDMARDGEGFLFVVRRHGFTLGEVEMKESFQTFDGLVAVFGDERVSIKMSDEELLETSILSGDGGTEASEARRITPDFIDGADTGVCGVGSGSFNQIGSEGIENVLESFAEFEFFPGGRTGAVNEGISVAEEGNLGAEQGEVEKFRFAGIIEVGGVVGDFVDPVDEL